MLLYWWSIDLSDQKYLLPKYDTRKINKFACQRRFPVSAILEFQPGGGYGHLETLFVERFLKIKVII